MSTIAGRTNASDSLYENTFSLGLEYTAPWLLNRAEPARRTENQGNVRQECIEAMGRSPAVLVFRKSEPGNVEFCGLCVPDHMEVRSYQDDSGAQIPNYLFHLSILNTQSIPVSWLLDRAQMDSNERVLEV